MSTLSERIENVIFVSLISSGIFLARQLIKLLVFKKELKRIEGQKKYSVEEIKKLLDENNEEFIENFSKVQTSREIFTEGMLIYGILNSPTPITSNKGSQLVYEMIKRYPLFSNQKIEKNISKFGFVLNSGNSYEIFTLNKALNVHLSDIDDWDYKINLDTRAKSIKFQGEIMEEIGFKSHYYKLKLYEKFTKFFHSVWWYFLSFFGFESWIKGIEIGYLDDILGIKIGSSATVYAKLVYDIAEKSLRIDTPFMISKTADEIKEKIKKNIIKYRIDVFKGILGVSTIVLIYYIFKLTERKRRGLLFPQSSHPLNNPNLKSIDKEFDPIEERMVCIICYEKARSVIFLPCMHLVSCTSCEKRDRRKETCPVCRGRIEKKIPIIIE